MPEKSKADNPTNDSKAELEDFLRDVSTQGKVVLPLFDDQEIDGMEEQRGPLPQVDHEWMNAQKKKILQTLREINEKKDRYEKN